MSVSRVSIIAIGLLAAVLLAAVIVSRTGVDTLTPTGQNQNAVAATVNGQPIYRSNVVIAQRMLEHGDPPASSGQAYTDALEVYIDAKIVEQELVSRGIATASPTTQSKIAEDYKAASFRVVTGTYQLDDTRQAAGLSSAEFDVYLKDLAKRQLELEALRDALLDTLPSPAPSQVSGYVQQNLQDSQLSVISINYSDTSLAARDYNDFLSSAQTESDEDLVQQFSEKKRGIESLADDAALIESFEYSDVLELPDYAQTATTMEVGEFGLIDREDASSVVFLVVYLAGQPSATQNASEAFVSVLGNSLDEHLADVLDVLRQSAVIVRY